MYKETYFAVVLKVNGANGIMHVFELTVNKEKPWAPLSNNECARAGKHYHKLFQ